MKKNQKRLFSLLMAGMMICMTVFQVSASWEYDASGISDEKVLFPGDKLTGISEDTSVTLDGEQVTLEEAGTWKNSETDVVYTASLADDGSLSLKEAGYVLVVNGGTSGNADSDNHYKLTDEEKAELSESSKLQDIAYYEEGETVKLTAGTPEEGMEFAGWTTDTEGVAIADASASETTVTMPDKKVTVTATYQEVQAQEPDVIVESEAADDGASDDTAAADDATPEDTGAADDAVVPDDGGTADDEVTPEDTGAADDTGAPENTGAEDENISLIGDSDIAIISEDGSDAGNTAEPVLYNVTVNDGTGGGSFEAGAWVTIEAADRSGENYEFTGWYVESLNASLDDPSAVTTGFTMPESDVTVTATYEEAVVYYDAVIENGSGTGEYAPGETVTIEAPEKEGEVFKYWETSSNIELADPSAASASFTMPAESVTVTAVYEAVVDDENTEETPTEAPAETTPDTTAETPAETPAETTAETTPDTTPETPAETTPDTTAETPAETTVETTPDTTPETPAETTPDTTPETPAEPASYSVTVENGSTADSGSSYSEGATVVVNASQVLNNLTFDHWEGTASLTAADGTVSTAEVSFNDPAALNTYFTMPAGNVTVKAVYKPVVTVANGLINNEYTSLKVESGTSVTITANANPSGQVFSEWKADNGASSLDLASLGIAADSSAITVTVTQNMNFTAQYEGAKYTITISDGIANYTSAVSGTVVTITADKAPAGMAFDHWVVTTGNASLTNAYSSSTTFTMPAGDVSIYAVFEETEYTVTVENGYGSGTTFYLDDEVTIYSDYPASGLVFDQWVATSGNVVFADASKWQTTFSMPSSNVTVRATYTSGPSPDNNAILDIVPGGDYNTGDTITFTASGAGMGNTDPNPGDYRYRPSGYQIGNVTGTWSASPYTTSMAIKATGEYTLKVTFAKEVWDGTQWVADGTTDSKSVTFNVITRIAGVATGDDTPLLLAGAVAVAACVLFIILLVVFIRRRRNQR